MNMSTQLLYNDFPTFLRKYFPYKVQKISLNAGFTCPNRDGTKGWGGCTYCNNQTFNPDYCRTEKSITTQLEEGKCFFAHKYPGMKYLAYFQAYTNTYAELEGLKRKYEEALTVDGVVGLVIGTRPDCMPESLLRYLEELNKHTFLMLAAINGMEFGEALATLMDKKICNVSFRTLKSVTGLDNTTVSNMKKGKNLTKENVVSCCLGIHIPFRLSNRLLQLAERPLDLTLPGAKGEENTIYDQILHLYWAEDYSDTYAELVAIHYEHLIHQPPIK